MKGKRNGTKQKRSNSTYYSARALLKNVLNQKMVKEVRLFATPVIADAIRTKITRAHTYALPT